MQNSAEALVYYMKASEIQKKILGTNHPDYGATLYCKKKKNEPYIFFLKFNLIRFKY